jgi:hypothetical protein
MATSVSTSQTHALPRYTVWLAVALVTLGALTTGLVFFWTIVGSIAAIALIVLFVLAARGGSPAAAKPSILGGSHASHS